MAQAVAPQFLLLLVSTPGVNTDEDFAELAEWIGQFDPRIEAHVCRNDGPAFAEFEALGLPTLCFSPGPTRRTLLPFAALYQGRWLPKSVEYQRLEAGGFPVPPWMRLTPNSTPSVESFGQYVVVKPEFGAQGADVRIVRSNRLQWRPPATACARRLGGPDAPFVVQRFIYSGPWARSYRVTTLFGEVLWAVAIEASHERRALLGCDGFASLETGSGTSIVSSGKGCTIELSSEPDVLDLAQRAHAAFPEIPLLGFDVVREQATGKLYIIEANSGGLCWHFTSDTGTRFQREFDISLEAQFDGRRRAARILAERTVRLAR